VAARQISQSEPTAPPTTSILKPMLLADFDGDRFALRTSRRAALVIAVTFDQLTQEERERTARSWFSRSVPLLPSHDVLA
jgi:hypothetical protein